MKNESSPALPPKLSVTAGDLRCAVNGLSKAMSRKPGLPVLACVLVELLGEAKEKHLRFTATDLTLTLSLNLPVHLSGPGSVPVPPFLLPMDRLRNLARAARPHELVPLAPVRSAPPVSEFPVSHGTPAAMGQPVILPEEAVIGCLRALACASSDQTRPVLLGACLDGGDSGGPNYRAVGTDGRHLYAGKPFRVSGLPSRFILPAHPIWSWKPLRESRPWRISLGEPTGDESLPRAFRLEGPFWSLQGLSVEGRYPAYQAVLPREANLRTRVDLPERLLPELVRLLPLLPGHEQRDGLVGFEVTARGEVQLLHRDADQEIWEARPLAGVRAQGPAVRVFTKREHLIRGFAFGLNRVEFEDDKSVFRLSRDGECLVVMPKPLAHQAGELRVVRGAVIGASDSRPSVPARSIRTAPVIAKATPPVRESRPRRSTSPPPPPAPRVVPAGNKPPRLADPMAEAEGKLGLLQETLRGLRDGLVSVSQALKLARRQKREIEREVRTARKRTAPLATGEPRAAA